mmetsp:Transcript_152025/g.276449  ORF Transcript_152025/g.276449 Transcript_152025/m.276449 type:complete len:259 (+) Transcript_152025:345-1121(+)
MFVCKPRICRQPGFFGLIPKHAEVEELHGALRPVTASKHQVAVSRDIQSIACWIYPEDLSHRLSFFRQAQIPHENVSVQARRKHYVRRRRVCTEAKYFEAMTRKLAGQTIPTAIRAPSGTETQRSHLRLDVKNLHNTPVASNCHAVAIGSKRHCAQRATSLHIRNALGRARLAIPWHIPQTGVSLRVHGGNHSHLPASRLPAEVRDRLPVLHDFLQIHRGLHCSSIRIDRRMCYRTSQKSLHLGMLCRCLFVMLALLC